MTLNGAICSIKELSEDKAIEEYIYDSLKNAFPSKTLRKIVIESLCEYLLTVDKLDK